ncbi:MAG: DUF4286 family protein [Gammaproteobacteria bacterium]
MTDGTLIYEVTLDVKRRVAKRFDAWLKLHMRDMLSLPGFLDACLLPPDQIPASTDASTLRRVVRYQLASRADLENYLSQHAARMRAESARYFGKQLHTSRRLLDADGQEVALGQDIVAALAQPLLRCLNCNAPLSGKYCSECGQPSHTYAAPLRADIEDFFGNHVGFDTKFFRSIGPLLFRPGFLSREYSAGRRVRYINPLRLYIFSSILFFLVAWSITPSNFFHFNDHSQLTSSAKSAVSLSPAEQQDIRNNPYLSKQQKQTILDNAAGRKSKPGNASNAAQKHVGLDIDPIAEPKTSVTDTDNSTNNINGNIFGRKFSMPKSEFETRMIHAMESYLPKLMFVFLPLVALLLKLFYLRSRRYYMEHLIFALHNHAFIFVAMLVMVLVNLLGRHVAWVSAPSHYFNVILGWYIVIYVFLAMLFYYRQSFIKTLMKYLLIGSIYWIALMGVLVGGVMLILAYVVAA